MQALLKNIRFYILTLTIVWVLAVYIAIHGMYAADPAQQTTKLTEVYALTAISLLYITLLISPLLQFFPRIPHKDQYIKARRALGVSTALVAVTHAYNAFFGELGGFRGLPFLNDTYLGAIVMSSIALLILLLMAATSFDYMVRKLGGKRWTWLHRFVYLAAILIIIHALRIGSQFAQPTSSVYRFSFIAFSFLVVLEALRVDRWLYKNMLKPANFGIVTLLTVSSLTLSLTTFFAGGTNSVHLHGSTVSTTVATSSDVHFHANFLVRLNGQNFDFTPNKYMEPVSLCQVGSAAQSPEGRVHMHNNIGNLVHIHAAQVTWGDFFANLGWAVSDTGIVTDSGQTYLADSSHRITAMVNGQPVTKIAQQYIKANDRLLLNYGPETAAQLSSVFAQVPATAAQVSATSDPLTCSGS